MKPLYHRFLSEPWAITEAGAIEFATRFSYEIPAHVTRKASEDDTEDDNDVTDMFGKKLVSSQMLDGIGIVSINGAMIAGGGFLENLFGGVSHGQVESAITSMAERNPAAIILDWNSPGGSVSGTAELAGTVAEISSNIPVYSFCGSGLCASAAYWVGSSAGAGFYASPSAMVGSIGCLMQTASFSRLLENAGIDVKTFTSGPYKASGNPATKLTDDQAGYLQALTDEIGADFKSAVQKNRPGVDASAFDGRIFSSRQAQAYGLIDGTVANSGAMIAKVQSNFTAPSQKKVRGLNDMGRGKAISGEAEWNRNAALRAEFGNSKSAYLAYMKNSSRGTVAQRQPIVSLSMSDFKKTK